MSKTTIHYWLCPNCETLNSLNLLECEVCGDPMPIEFRTPIIKSLNTSPKDIKDNETFIVSWITENAKYVTLNGVRVPANGSKKLIATDKVLLRASNPNGKVEKLLNINVMHVMRISKFSLDSNEIVYGNSCKIKWQAVNVKKITFEGKEYSTESEITFFPKEARLYYVNFEGIDGSKIIKEIKIDLIYPDPIISIDAPQYANNGQNVIIKWESSYVEEVIIDGKKFTNNGSYEFPFSEKTSLKTMEFYSHGVCVYTKKIFIHEALSPKVDSCILSGCTFKYNDDISVKWTGDNIVKWYIDDGCELPSTQKTAKLKAVNKLITIHFIGENKSEIIRNFNIDIIHDPIIRKCQVSSFSPIKGIPCVIEWNSEYVKSVKIKEQTFGPTGSYTFTPQKSEIIVVKFIAAESDVTICRNLSIFFPSVKIKYFEADRSQVSKGSTCNVRWDSQNVEYVIIKEQKYPSKCSIMLNPVSSETIVAEFYGFDGTIIKRELEIIVIHPDPQVIKCELLTPHPRYGFPCEIVWKTNFVNKVIIDDTVFFANDKYSFVPCKNTTLTIEFVGDNSKKIFRTINIILQPLIIDYFRTEETEIYEGHSYTISWHSTNVQYVIINGYKYTSCGELTKIPDESETIEAFFYGIDGSIQKRVINIVVKEQQGGCCMLFLVFFIFLMILIFALAR